ncbi:MAG: ATP-dependent DNA ligase, partial [Thermoanaerobaculia bacterium]
MLSDFTVVANAIAATTKKSVKERLLADYLTTLDDAALERAAVFFSGSPFPRRDERVTGIGGAAVSDAVAEATGHSAEQIWASWSKFGDAGDTIAEHFPNDPSLTITLPELGQYFDRIAATSGATEKKSLLAELLRKVDAQGARFVVKILVNELRIGLQEGLVEAAIAKAFGRKLELVRRANMFTGDIGAAALLAKGDALESAKMSLFRPFAFMLAQPEEDPAEIVAALGEGAFADDKYDGIRAQIHTDGEQVRIYSRTLDDVTHRFPEIEAAARRIGRSMILDGEIVAFSDRILPFAVIQTRLGRKKISEKLLAEAPVAFFAFDLVSLDGEPLFETPLKDRLDRMRSALKDTHPVRLGDQSVVRDAAHVDEIFDAARARANEGLVVKDPNSF